MSFDIRFPVRHSEYVRSFSKTRDDFIRLARCYNSFKDSDSWPDGFGGSFTFTVDYLSEQLRNIDTEHYFVVFDPNDPDKVIGVSFLGGAHVKGCYYVQFLGVDPAYQKRGFGKALLLRCTRYAFTQRSQLISLYTWPGNLKAMPLYKRQGYKWRPDTGVYMENFIPQILNYPFFSSFFSSLSGSSTWYDCFRPVIDQEPNLEFDGRMHIYEYYFEDRDRFLRVWIDRTIGWISGFHLKTDVDDLLVKLRVNNSRVFIGIEDFDIVLVIENRSNIERCFSLDFSFTSQFKLIDFGDLGDSVIVRPHGRVELIVKASLLPDTSEFRSDQYDETFVEHKFTFNLGLNGLCLPLSIGVLPSYAIKAQLPPEGLHLPVSREIFVPINLVNKLGHSEDVIIDISDGEFIKFYDFSKTVNVSSYDSSVSFRSSVKESSTCVDWFRLKISALDGKIFFDTSLPVFISNGSQVVSYEFDGQLFIENKYLRISLFKEPVRGTNEIIIYDKVHALKLCGLAPILGYPFDDEGSEFYHLPLEHNVLTKPNGILLLSSSRSDKRSGIIVVRRVFLPSDSSFVEINWELKNDSTDTITNLGLMDMPYWYPDRQSYVLIVLPVKDRGICHFNNNIVSVSLGKDPSVLSESWHASVFNSGTIGFLFDRNSIDEIELGTSFPRISHRIGDLPAGHSFITKPVQFLFTDTWQQVRHYSKQLTAFNPDDSLEYWLRPVPLRRIGISAIDSGLDNVFHALVLDRSATSINFSIDTFQKTVLKGLSRIIFQDMSLVPDEFSLPGVEASSWKKELNFVSNKVHRVVSGSLEFDSLTRIYTIPLALAFYDRSSSVDVRFTNGFYEVDNGFFRFRASDKFRGQVFWLCLNGSDFNLLHTGNSDFPHVRPYMWWNKFYGGIGLVLRPAFDFDPAEYNTLTFSPEVVSEGLWSGVSFSSNVIFTKPGSSLKGLQLTTSYLTLPDSPFLLVRSIITNHSDTPRRFYLRHEYSLKTSCTTDDFYYIRTRDNDIARYHLNAFEGMVNFERSDFSRWVSFKRSGSDYYLSTILPRVFRDAVVSIYAPNLDFVLLSAESKNFEVLPHSSFTFSSLFLLSDSLSSVEPFTSSNLFQLFPDDSCY